ncbi:hypothetical protein [Streptomyces anulatus]|uniref:hypothetical protein n=1 Tax=Streptomyces anulatus TaxID=1892 RepID=UPI003437F796
MSASAADHSWLPDHQLHVAATLAHVDQTIDRVARLTHDYSKAGPLTLTNLAEGNQSHVTVAAVAPLPLAIPRLIADALTQLRAAMEHTLYTEVEHRLGRSMTAQEARCIEMPACASADDFAKWLRHGRRSQLQPLHLGAPLAERIRTLQPFQRRDSDDHPLRLLVEHTNLAKHRTPAVAATRLGAIYPDKPHPGLTVALPLQLRPQAGDGLPLRAGDILASGPLDARIPISVMPTVSLQRPHTGVWNIAIRELEHLEEWVRTSAIPILVTGTRDVTPLPPQLDIMTGHEDLRGELANSESTTAAQRARQRMMAQIARSDLVDLLSGYGSNLSPAAVSTWVHTLDDIAVLQKTDRLIRVVRVPTFLLGVMQELRDEVRAQATETGH